ncbi:MAG TPA: nodulation protein NfeD [Gallionellaceae bacterium]|nr:nodulation protein NfeD [Gallionellaceae bacterium]
MTPLSILRSLLFTALLAATPGFAAGGPPLVVVIAVDGAISPGSADYIVRGLKTAAAQGAELAVLEMDTPGGLDTSMRQIIKQIIASPVPVAGFVAPDGARAASAGTYILYACHIAAMAPATNLGAATPIMIGLTPPGGAQPEPGSGNAGSPAKGEPEKGRGAAPEQAPVPTSTEARKSINDASAYIRSLAQLRGRNAAWGERAVREAVSLTSSEALQNHVIDLVATGVPDLLRKLDGRKVSVLGAMRTLNLKDARIERLHPDWRSRMLSVIADPSVAYLLMLAGIFGLFFEFSNPGFVLPGVIGAISLLLALFAFQMMPVNYVGVALILLGIAFMIAEVYISSFGVLGVGGIAAFVIGSVMLMHTDIPGYGGVPWSIIAPFALITALFIFVVAGMALKARGRPVTSGSEEMTGLVGTVLQDTDGTAAVVHLHGENWSAHCSRPLRRGQKVKVTAIDGLVLEVEPESEEGTPPAAAS